MKRKEKIKIVNLTPRGIVAPTALEIARMIEVPGLGFGSVAQPTTDGGTFWVICVQVGGGDVGGIPCWRYACTSNSSAPGYQSFFYTNCHTGSWHINKLI